MSDAGDPNRVGLAAGCHGYPADPPYSPVGECPEYPFPAATKAQTSNAVYAAVREALRLGGLDAERYGTASWNPLGEAIQPGQTVLVKPNLVRHLRDTLPGLGDCVITHGAVIRAVVDYVYIALAARGRIIVADAPMDDASFEALVVAAGLDELREFYRRHAGFEIEILDLRLHHDRKINGIIVGRTPLPGDPAGYVEVDLGEESAFRAIEPLCARLYGATYDIEETRRHHRHGRHAYLISRTALSADCIVEVPKLKTHQKVGVTANMKLLVGVCGNKDCIAHYRVGVPRAGGDQFDDNGPRSRLEYCTLGAFKRGFRHLGPLRRWLARPVRAIGEMAFGRTNKVVRSGNWYGNDTAWRMAHDLLRIMRYADAQGRLADRPVRRLFSVVDGIVAGEGDGPLDASPHGAGVVLAGVDPVAVDRVCGRLMGFDLTRMPILQHAWDPHPRPLTASQCDAIEVHANENRFQGRVTDWQGPMLAFKPHFGWRGHIEIHE